MIATDRLLDVLVEMADSLVADFDLIEFLHHMADHTAAISDRASVGVILGDSSTRLNVMATSSPKALDLEVFQLEVGEGPCVECYATRQPVIVPDLAGAVERWPRFTAGAADLGIRSVHAFPMRLRDTIIGAINVFGEEEIALEPGDIKAIQAIADVASIAILQERAVSAAEVLTEQLEGALRSRITIEQAKGVVSATLDIEVDAAFAMLRSRARVRGVRLTALAEVVVSGAVLPRDLRGS